MIAQHTFAGETAEATGSLSASANCATGKTLLDKPEVPPSARVVCVKPENWGATGSASAL